MSSNGRSAGITAAGVPRRDAARHRAARALALVVLGALATAPASGRVLLTQGEALALAFPGCEVERQTLYLDAAQVARAAQLAGVPVPGALVHAYRGRCSGQPAGVAYFDTHVVRTLPETVMVVVDPQGRTARVEVVAFQEPPDYLPRGAWYEQFRGRPLAPDLALRRAVHPVTGATLTARATTAAVRRVLALHQVIGERAAADTGAAQPGAPGGRPRRPGAGPGPASGTAAASPATTPGRPGGGR